MTIESIVTSLETSKKLAEIGLKRETVFYYLVHENGFIELGQIGFGKVSGKKYYPAYTAQELLSIIPAYIDNEQMIITHYEDHELVEYLDLNAYFISKKSIEDKNLAEALAKMAICLHENGYPLCD